MAVIVALTFSAIFLAVAVAIDFARPQTEVVRVENAAAAAALAVSHRLGLPDQDTTDWQDRDAPFKVTSSTPDEVGIPMQAEQGQPRATAKANMLTSLLKAVGGKSIGFGASTSVKKGRGTLEVALVLNNSGSMAGQPLADLGVAAKNLTSVLFAGYEGADKVRLAILPFAGSVSVGGPSRARPGPFTEGRPYGDPENMKYLILMTDGGNEHQAVANHNYSIYHALVMPRTAGSATPPRPRPSSAN